MASRRENGMGSMLRRTQRSENSSPYKRRTQTRRSPPPPAKIPSSSSLSSFLSIISAPFRRKVSSPVLPAATSNESEESEDDASGDDVNGAEHDEQEEEDQKPPESAPELGLRRPLQTAKRLIEDARDSTAATTLSRMGQSLQQSIPQPKVLPPSTLFSSIANKLEANLPSHEITSSASTSHIAPLSRPRRNVQPSFATVSRASGKRTGRPSFPGGIGSYGGFTSTAELSPPPFAATPLESSFAANRNASTSANPNLNRNPFSFNTSNNISQVSGISIPDNSQSLVGKTSSEVLAEFFASKGKAPLTAEERKKVARLMAASDAEANAASPDEDPYNGIPSFSFLKATFPEPERTSMSPSSSFNAGDAPVNSNSFSFNLSTSSSGTTQPSKSAPNLSAAVAPRRRRPINYGGANNRSAAITRAGFTLREHQKLQERQKAVENAIPDASTLGDKRGARDGEEDGGGKRRRMNDGQASSTDEQPKHGVEGSGVARVMNLSAQPSMPSPLRQMTKLNSPSPPRVVRRAQAPSPSSPLALSSDINKTTSAAPTPAATKPKPRTSIVANVMRDMLAEDKKREKEQEKEKSLDKGRDEVFVNPYEDAIPAPVVAAPKVRKPRRESARPGGRSGLIKQSQGEAAGKPLTLFEKIEKTDVRPNGKKSRTIPDSSISTPPPVITSIPAPPTLTFTAPSPRDTKPKPKSRRPAPVVEEPVEPPTSSEIEVIDLDEEDELVQEKDKGGRPALTIDMSKNGSQNGTPGGERGSSREGSERGERGGSLLGIPRSRPSFSLHSPARPSPLREMSVPIEDEVESEIEELVPASGGVVSINGFGSASGFGSTANGINPTNGTLLSFGFSAPAPVSAPTFSAPLPAPTFSAPLPPPAPALTPAQLPTPVKEATKVAPLFTPKTEVPKPESAPVTLKADAPAFIPKPTKPLLNPTPASKAEVPIAVPKADVPTSPKKADSKLSAQSVPISSLPTFTFTASVLITATMVPQTAEARDAAKVPLSNLPTFSFGQAFTAPTSAPAQTSSFNWAAAGMKPPSSSAGGKWKCGTCDCMNEANATTKCSVCETPKPAASVVPTSAPASARTASFDWAAAGMKAPSTGSDAQWKCTTCDCMNPASVTAKCTVCETPKPAGSTSTPAPAPAPAARTASFDWGAAGMKAPTTVGAWTCGTCGLSNKNASASKCEICESPR